MCRKYPGTPCCPYTPYGKQHPKISKFLILCRSCKYPVVSDKPNHTILPSVLSIACAIIFRHIILKTVPTSMSSVEGERTRGMAKQTQCPSPYIHCFATFPQTMGLSICTHAVHLGSTLGPLPHVPTGKAILNDYCLWQYIA